MASDPAAPARDDADDAMTVTRESLDGPTIRSKRSADGQLPPEYIPVAGERQLTARQKAQRGATTALLFIVTLYLLLGGPTMTLNAARSLNGAIDARLHPPKPRPTLAQYPLIRLKSPPGAYNQPRLNIAPATGPGGAAWLCWTTSIGINPTLGQWVAHPYYTGNAGDGWRPLALPFVNAPDCSVFADSLEASTALFVLSGGQGPDGVCAAPSLLLTIDTGATWKRVPWPTGATTKACAFQAALSAGVIYLWSTQPMLPGSNPYVPPTGRLIVSTDAGQSWKPADIGLDDTNGFDIVGFRPGGRILATIADVRGDGSSARLMSSNNFGQGWHDLGAVPGAFPQVFVSSDNSITDHGGWGRLYAISERNIGSTLPVPIQRIISTAYVGQAWSTLSLPPMAPGVEDNLPSREPQVVGVGPAQSLMVERGIVESRNAQFGPSRRLWVWDPAHRDWLLDPLILPGNLELQGGAWSGGDLTYWMTTLQLGVPPVLLIYMKTLTPQLRVTAPSESSTSASTRIARWRDTQGWREAHMV